ATRWLPLIRRSRRHPPEQSESSAPPCLGGHIFSIGFPCAAFCAIMTDNLSSMARTAIRGPMKSLQNIPIFLFVLIFSVSVLAQSACPDTVQTALTQTHDLCDSTGRNQVCFGHDAISATAWPGAPSLTFSQAGDM